jgi:hypothetical protein
MGSAILDLYFTILHFGLTIFVQHQLNPHHFSEKKSNWLMLDPLLFFSLPNDKTRDFTISSYPIPFRFVFFLSSSKHDNAGE